MKLFRKWICVILSVFFVFFEMPVAPGQLSVKSEIRAEAVSGTCGTDISWQLSSDGTLTISGTGPMNDWKDITDTIVFFNTDIEHTPWYEQRKTIQKIVIGQGVTSIGEFAFSGCSSLNSISIPDSVTVVGTGAFADCKNLTSVTLPNSVTHLYAHAFENCTGLTHITMSEKIYTIKEMAFRYCRSLESLAIPDSVTIIGEAAFEGCDNLTSITLPQKITSIEAKTFHSCFCLKSVIIPEKVNSIKERAFEECESLESVTIKNPDCQISYSAFVYSWSNSLIIYGYSGSTAQTYAKDYDQSFVALDPKESTAATDIINVPDNSTTGTCGKNLTWSLNQTTWVLTISGTGDMTDFISESSPFYHKKIKSIIIMDGVTGIGDYAFAQCENLNSVSIPKSVTRIGNNAFLNCSSLTSVSVLQSVSSIGDSAFYGCSSLSSFGIMDSTKSIGSYAFAYCSALTSFSVSKSVTSIGESAFQQCTSLARITISNRNCDIFSTSSDTLGIPASTVIYGYVNSTARTYAEEKGYTFEPIDPEETIATTEPAVPSATEGSCGDNLTWFLDKEGTLTISGTGEMTNWDDSTSPWCSNRDKIKTVIIENGVTSVGNRAFCFCQNLTAVNIADSVTSIGNRAFAACESLKYVTMSNSVISIGDYAFDNCTSLYSITIPDSVASIGIYAFWECTSLNSVIIPQNVTSIGQNAFSSCEKLTSVTIYGSLTSIKGCLFYNCKSLNSITLPESVESIEYSAFQGCESLNTITLPASVTSIGDSAFDSCINLTSVIIKNPKCQFGTQGYESSTIYQTATIYGYQNSTAQAYAETYNRKFIVLKNEPVETTFVQTTTVSTRQTTVTTTTSEFQTLPVTTTSATQTTTVPVEIIKKGNCGQTTAWRLDSEGTFTVYGTGIMDSRVSPAYVPWNDDRLAIKKVVIQERVTSIGSYAFESCSNLTSVTFPKSLESLQDRAFCGCTGLTSVAFSDNMAYIGYMAFSDCSGLKSITIKNPDCWIDGSDNTIPDTAIIYGYPDSTAQAYAEANNRTFVALEKEETTSVHSTDSEQTTTTAKETISLENIKIQIPSKTFTVSELRDMNYKVPITIHIDNVSDIDTAKFGFQIADGCTLDINYFDSYITKRTVSRYDNAIWLNLEKGKENSISIYTSLHVPDTVKGGDRFCISYLSQNKFNQKMHSWKNTAENKDYAVLNQINFEDAFIYVEDGVSVPEKAIGKNYIEIEPVTITLDELKNQNYQVPVKITSLGDRKLTKVLFNIKWDERIRRTGEKTREDKNLDVKYPLNTSNTAAFARNNIFNAEIIHGIIWYPIFSLPEDASVGEIYNIQYCPDAADEYGSITQHIWQCTDQTIFSIVTDYVDKGLVEWSDGYIQIVENEYQPLQSETDTTISTTSASAS